MDHHPSIRRLTILASLRAPALGWCPPCLAWAQLLAPLRCNSGCHAPAETQDALSGFLPRASPIALGLATFCGTPAWLSAFLGAMNSHLLNPGLWAQQQFEQADLGDERRNQRLIRIATGLATHPGGTMPQAFPEWKQLKATYRFLSQPKITPQAIQQPHWESTRQECCRPGEYLLIEDTSELDYTGHDCTEDLGCIGDGNGRGLLLHSTLAVRVENWQDDEPQGVIVGLLGQKCWARSVWNRPDKSETQAERLSRSRESQRWAEVFDQIELPGEQCVWIYIADRESDFYEPIERCQRHKLDFIIRAYQDRRIIAGPEDQQEHTRLKEAVAKAPALGRIKVELRARPGKSARTATVELRSCWLTCQGPWRPGGKRENFQLNVVEAREVDPPNGEKEPLHWLLLTSLRCKIFKEARRIVARYAKRWTVEDYHKALKTGTRVEESQLERGYRIETLVGVLAVVAVRLLSTRYLASSCPDVKVDAEQFGSQGLAILENKYGQPQGGWTHRTVLIALARLGGFPARRADGLPGWQTIWRGWSRLMEKVDGLEILNNRSPRSG